MKAQIAKDLKDLSKPSARCYKGLSILTAIWGFGTLVICAIVPALIFKHMDTVHEVTTTFKSSSQKSQVIRPPILFEQ
jgi:hypothetical protein